ncbi:FG-GAP-like repeat-containing protein [Dolichospermum sp. ST_sed2]|nr:FG-GAP-like repeat-containing protein [Dolichospermum sp. ST_sed2]
MNVGAMTFGGAVTVETWVYVNQHQLWQRIIDFGNGANSDNIVLCWSATTGQMAWGIYQGTSNQSLSTNDIFPTNQWVHVAAVADGQGNGYIYWNGQLKASGNILAPLNITRNNAYIGRSNWTGDSYFNGKLDEVRIWNKALSPSDIQVNMNRTLSGQEAGLLGYWNFDEGTGTTGKNLASNSNQNNATLINGATFTAGVPLNTVISGTDIVNNLAQAFTPVNISLPDFKQVTNWQGSSDWGDYDNDGDLDLLITGQDSYGNGIAKIYTNNNDPINPFDTDPKIVVDLDGLDRIQSTKWGDYNNDGKLDLLIIGHDNLPLLDGQQIPGREYFAKVYLNKGNKPSDVINDQYKQFTVVQSISLGKFENPDQFDNISLPAVDWADYNHDGKLEILTSAQLPTPLTGGSLNSVDYNNDGFIDVIATGLNATLQPTTLLYQGNGTGTFTADTANNLKLTGVGVTNSNVAWGDYDNNGALDLLLSGETKVTRTGVTFDGIDDSGIIPNSDKINFNTNDNFTVETWIKADPTQAYQANGDNDIIGKWGEIGGYPFIFKYIRSTGKIIFARYDGKIGAEIDSLTAFNDGKFHHIAFVKNGSNLFLYVDGNLEGQTTDTTINSTQNTSALYLGRRGVDNADINFFTGSIDEIRIWNVARSQSDIQANMNRTLSGQEGGLVGYWNFDENTGTTVKDLTNNQNNGTLVNGPTFTTGVPLNEEVTKLYQNSVVNNVRTLTEIPGIPFTGVSDPSLQWADYNNDGKLDVLLTGTRNGQPITEVYQGNGNDSFTLVSNILMTSVQHGEAKWGDYNGDGKLDIIVTGAAGRDGVPFAQVYLNNTINANVAPSTPGKNKPLQNADGSITLSWNPTADGTTNEPGISYNLIIGTTAGGADILSGLANKDTNAQSSIEGRPQVAQIGNVGESSKWTINGLKTGTVYYWNIQAVDPGLKASNFAPPYENSFIPNFINWTQLTTASLLTNPFNPDQTFQYDTDSTLERRAYGDYDNDGDLDQLIADGINLFVLEKQAGQPDRNYKLTGLDQVTFSKIAWVDYDNDGKLDIVVSSASGNNPPSVAFFTNTTSLRFNQTTQQQEKTTEFVKVLSNNSVTGQLTAIRDYDGDGDLDVILGTNVYTNQIAQAISRPNTKPTAPTELSTTVISSNQLNLSWQVGTDKETPKDGLSYNLRIGTTPGGNDILAPITLESLKQDSLIHQLDNNNNRIEKTLNNLVLPTGIYYWSVQTVDTAFTGSDFASERVFSVGDLTNNVKISNTKVTKINNVATTTAYVLKNADIAELSFDIANTGQLPQNIDYQILLSQDQTIDASDIYLSVGQITGLTTIAAGTSQTFTKNVLIPSSFPGFTSNNQYILINVVNQSLETKTDDNLTTLQIQISDPLFSAVTTTLPTNVKNLLLTGSAAINGTGNGLDNYIIGNSGNNILNGGIGNDTLDGGLGNDTLIGGSENNILIGGLGSDRLDGSLGNDTASYVNASASVTVNLALTTAQTGGEATGDILLNIENLIGSKFDDTLAGNTGSNIINGGFGNDSLTGGTGNDTYIVDSAGDIVTETSTLATEIDTVQAFVSYTLGDNVENLNLIGTSNIDGTGNSSKNTITGNSGNNILNGGLESDRLDGGTGIDTASYANASTAVTVNLALTTAQTGGEATGDILLNIENLLGSNFNDTLSGNSGNNILDGGFGHDSLTGGTGNDTYIVDSAGDIATETSTLATEIDTVQASISYILGNNLENLLLLGTDNINGTGNSLNNTIAGNAGNNILDGGTGADTLTGGTGNDSYNVDNIGDVVTETSILATEIDTVQASISYTLGNNLENLNLFGTGNINGTGNSLNNTITGNSGNNTLDGGTGVDTLIGGTGNDSYNVDNIGDVVTETSILATEIDTVQASVSYTLSNNLENLLLGTGNIDGTGNNLNNTITGNSGNNILNGRAGADTLDGGTGIDTASYANASAAVTVNLALTTAQTGGEATGDILRSIENLIGSSFNDTLTGNIGNNILDGGIGADSLIGGTGNDTYIVDSAGDIVTEISTLATEIDTVQASISYILGNNLKNLLLLGTNNINGTGNSLNNTIAGNAGNNILDGGTGADTLTGGTGNDSYNVDNIGDVVTETSILATEIDTVQASVSYILGNNLENLNLLGTGKIDGTGNSLNNNIIGNSGDNVLIGGLGSDRLDGGLGNDTASYINASAAVTVNLALTTAQTGGEATGDVLLNMENLLGSNFNDTLSGNTGNNILNGGGGADSLTGGIGNDSYYVDNLADTITENLNEGTDNVFSSITYTLGTNLENLNLIGTDNINGIGNSLNNTIRGNSANNLLNGGAGNDTLFRGLGGSDQFYFGSGAVFISTAFGVDTIADFIKGTDQVVLSKTSFKSLVSGIGGNLQATEFAQINTTTNESSVAGVSSAKIVYNLGTGNVFYNPDGNVAGLTNGGLFANVTGKPNLDMSDILIS